ncbi:MAG: hypothetical protein VYA69_11295 [Gemmatimonadota bacterium]|nr:hypothetical protein [Gemmatimonadota bacterium]
MRLNITKVSAILIYTIVLIVPGTCIAQEPQVTRIPGFVSMNEAYFSPDGKYLIMQARRDTTEIDYHTYVVSLDGSDVRRINDKGSDACSFFFPSGDRLVWTSTKDNLKLVEGDFSNPEDYPVGSELYVSDLYGGNVQRLTENNLYDAEVSVSPDGRWVLFGRNTDGSMDLWRMRSDGTELTQITNTDEEQEGGCFYLADSETIIYRSWLKKDEGGRGRPMTIYTINHDGTAREQITTDPGLNWAPYPSPDGKHFVYVRMVGRGNFEVFLMNIETRKKVQVTDNPAFDGYPSFSPNGKTIAFASSRGMPGPRLLAIHLMDISKFFPMVAE